MLQAYGVRDVLDQSVRHRDIVRVPHVRKAAEVDAVLELVGCAGNVNGDEGDVPQDLIL
jgi:hypothetical protein